MINKSVLLIGGGGTLGTYTANELLNFGCSVDVICLEDKVSHNEKLKFYKAKAELEFLQDFLRDKHYDGIVNFIHYPDVSVYPPVHKLLISSTEHLIVLSSYRVYANEEHPVTEQSPRLLDVSTDKNFLYEETYALSKAKLENFLNTECKGENWTVVRPVISFSKYRFDLVTYYGHDLLQRIKIGETISLPQDAKKLTAGLDWAGNSGKLIANLLFKKECFGEAYTISSAQNLTWGEVAEIYTELLGAKIAWVSLDEYLKATNNFNYYALIYDRLFDRNIDNNKVLEATGLKSEDFTSIKEGIKKELLLLEGEE